MSSSMMSTPSELVAAVMSDLPPDLRSLVEAHFYEGDSVVKIQRRHRLKRKVVAATLESALETICIALRDRGVRSVADVI
jgi:DNA-directed RNA polymerase specialized sigma24 family protein